MKLCISRLGTKLAVVANCFAPATLAATDPSAATVTFLRTVNGAFAASPLGTVTLTKVGGVTGVVGALIDVTSTDVSNLVAIAEATVGGVAMKEVVILGRSINTGSPAILIEAVEKNGDPNYGISK